jgi:FixJ family two-component response regulator
MHTPRASVAIVDDEESVRVALRRLCTALGLCATAYATGQDLIEALDGGALAPDCLLLDAHMPTMTGLEVHQHLLRRDVGVPTVVYTGDDAPEAEALYRRAGIADYLRKPISSDELLSAIERAIAASPRSGASGSADV